jgi:anti-anti-sigma regulatory factor
VLVDLSALRFIDSAAMHMIAAAHRAFRRDRGSLALVTPSPASRGPMEAKQTALFGSA